MNRVKVFWLIMTGVLLASAAVLMVRQNLDAAFVVAILGVCAWFLHYRTRMKEIINAADAERMNQGDGDEEY